jgi:hypothetical protein
MPAVLWRRYKLRLHTGNVLEKINYVSIPAVFWRRYKLRLHTGNVLEKM